MIRVLLIDDHAMFRAGLASLLEQTDDIRVVAEMSDGAFAVATVGEVRPDLVLMDIVGLAAWIARFTGVLL